MTVEQRIDVKKYEFPVGMRVLAVDDNPTCLMLLDTLLRKCQYHVTTATGGVMAMNMLRENKNKFDLVITDVHMPDMDGFKLLEQVGLEMDLPVIMLSAYGGNNLVMKGITHGACDYLLKPVRIEELQNIWQHVFRRKKFDLKGEKDFEKPRSEPGEVGQGVTGDSDKNGKPNRKRKDQNDDDEGEEHDESGRNNEDPSKQKKPRVVWSPELHRKFIVAVNQLGYDKAVPKRILEIMNEEKLTRENIASHLQKYRLYWKRMSCAASQQAPMIVALGSSDSAYSRMASMNGLENLQPLSGTGQFHNADFRSFSPNSVLGRFNTPVGQLGPTNGSMCVGMPSISSSVIGQLGATCNSSNPISGPIGLDMPRISSLGMGKMGSTRNSCSTINGPTNLGPVMQSGNQSGDILQGMPLSLEHDQLQHDSMFYPISSGFLDAKLNVDSSNNSLFGVSNNLVILEGHDSYPHAVQPSLPSIDLRDEDSSMTTHMAINSHNESSIFPGPTRFLDTRVDFLQSQEASVSSNVGQNMNFIPKQGWDEENYSQDAPQDSTLLCSSMNSSVPPCRVVGPFNERLDPQNTVFHMNDSFNLNGQHNEVELPALETALMLNKGCLKGQRMPQRNWPCKKC